MWCTSSTCLTVRMSPYQYLLLNSSPLLKTNTFMLSFSLSLTRTHAHTRTHANVQFDNCQSRRLLSNIYLPTGVLVINQTKQLARRVTVQNAGRKSSRKASDENTKRQKKKGKAAAVEWANNRLHSGEVWKTENVKNRSKSRLSNISLCVNWSLYLFFFAQTPSLSVIHRLKVLHHHLRVIFILILNAALISLGG